MKTETMAQTIRKFFAISIIVVMVIGDSATHAWAAQQTSSVVNGEHVAAVTLEEMVAKQNEDAEEARDFRSAHEAFLFSGNGLSAVKEPIQAEEVKAAQTLQDPSQEQDQSIVLKKIAKGEVEDAATDLSVTESSEAETDQVTAEHESVLYIDEAVETVLIYEPATYDPMMEALSELFGIPIEELEELVNIERREYVDDGWEVAVKFNDGAMRDTRILDVLGNLTDGKLPENAIFRFDLESADAIHGPVRLTDAKFSWDVPGGETLIARATYDEEGRVSEVDWRKTKSNCSDTFCTDVFFFPEIYIDTYTYGDNDKNEIVIERVDDTFWVYWIAGEPGTAQNKESAITLLKLSEDQYYITRIEEYDGAGNKAMVTEMTYGAEYSCEDITDPSTCTFGPERLKSIRREDANGNIWISDGQDRPRRIEKPGVGTLEIDEETGQAIVVQILEDGTVITTVYKDASGWNLNEIPFDPFTKQQPLRFDGQIRQIPGFEEVMGSLISTNTLYEDGYSVTTDHRGLITEIIKPGVGKLNVNRAKGIATITREGQSPETVLLTGVPGVGLLEKFPEFERYQAPEIPEDILSQVFDAFGDLFGMSAEELRDYISLGAWAQKDEGHWELTVEFKEGAMNDNRLLDALGNLTGGRMPGKAVLYFDDPRGPIELQNLSLSWVLADGGEITAFPDYDTQGQGRIRTVAWSQCEGLCSQSGQRTYFKDIYTYGDDDATGKPIQIVIKRRKFLDLSEYHNEEMGTESEITLARLEEDKFYVTEIKDYDEEGNVTLTTELIYGAEYSCEDITDPSTCTFGPMRLKSIHREDANGNIWISDGQDRPVYIEKPGVGIFEMDYDTDIAKVTRTLADGTVITETYKCVPGWNPDPGIFKPIVIQLPPPVDDRRAPIPGFEEVMGWLISTTTHYSDGYVMTTDGDGRLTYVKQPGYGEINIDWEEGAAIIARTGQMHEQRLLVGDDILSQFPEFNRITRPTMTLADPDGVTIEGETALNQIQLFLEGVFDQLKSVRLWINNREITGIDFLNKIRAGEAIQLFFKGHTMKYIKILFTFSGGITRFVWDAIDYVRDAHRDLALGVYDENNQPVGDYTTSKNIRFGVTGNLKGLRKVKIKINNREIDDPDAEMKLLNDGKIDVTLQGRTTKYVHIALTFADGTVKDLYAMFRYVHDPILDSVINAYPPPPLYANADSGSAKYQANVATVLAP